MNKSERDKLYIILFLVGLVLLDLTAIGGILLHGKANFPELIKHLKH
jgi:hypothetical protein